MSYKNKTFKTAQTKTAATTDTKATAKQSQNSRHSHSRVSGDIVRQPESEMALNRRNFIYMAGAGLLIIVGFLLMLGPSSTTKSFEPDIFSTRRIVIGPLLAFLGFVAMAIAIIVVPRKKSSNMQGTESDKAPAQQEAAPGEGTDITASKE